MPRESYDIGPRVQALALYGEGATRQRIHEVTGLSPSGVTRIIQKAKSRGYVTGGPILKAHVEDKPKSGRPTKPKPDGDDGTKPAKKKKSTTKKRPTNKIANAESPTKILCRAKWLIYLKRYNDYPEGTWPPDGSKEELVDFIRELLSRAEMELPDRRHGEGDAYYGG
ncbi:hypothetical protein Hte_008409 [Hypoxylon texense]